MIKGQIISGKFGDVLIRKKSDVELELGELLIAENKDAKMLLQVYDLIYGSQISQQNLELISGLNLEDHEDLAFMEPHLRNYTLARLKNLITIKEKGARSSKELPEFFTNVREVKEDDLRFLTKPENPLFVGHLRSGSKKLDLPVYLNAVDVLSHHVLITGTTGKGKSVLMKNLLWNAMDNRVGLLVLDPHDEYYGRNSVGLKDHPKKAVYYTTKSVPTGQRTLKINLKQIRPDHFDFMNLSGPQRQLMYTYYKKYHADWISSIFVQDYKEGQEEFHEMSLQVVRRQLKLILDLEAREDELICNGVFDLKAGESTIKDISQELEKENVVIIDTSNFSGQEELLIGSLITSEVFYKYKNYKMKGVLNEKPVISVVLEEAPRVLGKEVLEKGSNIFSTLAREGRKFKVGLVAITQLPSLIPREILANINTKIILGTEMGNERQAIIESASQDLSEDSRSIASLDKGEAIISSNFTKFAIPIKIPFFDEEVKIRMDRTKKGFPGIKLE